MSGRELVIQHVTERMIAAFTKGDVIDARNMDAFLGSLETMADNEYEDLVNAEVSGAIS